MKNEQMLQNAAKVMSTVDVGGVKRDPELAALDRGILQVALMVSGLDGTILPEEYQAFGEMAKRCRGATRKSIRSLYDDAIVKAGVIAGMANAGIYSESDRIAAFVRMAAEALPKGFACGSMADLRRAFVLWIAMGVSDGAFTGFERQAVMALVRRFALMRAASTKRFAALLEPDFVARAEKLLVEMRVASKRAKAEAALMELISTVAFKQKGAKVMQKAGRISLAVPVPGPTVTFWK